MDEEECIVPHAAQVPSWGLMWAISKVRVGEEEGRRGEGETHHDGRQPQADAAAAAPPSSDSVYLPAPAGHTAQAGSKDWQQNGHLFPQLS